MARARSAADRLIATEAVTEIEPASRPRGWVRIRAGRRAIALLHPREAEAMDLRVGAAVTEELERLIAAAEARSAVRRDAERLLARRAVAGAELEARLLAKEHGVEAVASVVAALKKSGAVDDARLAEGAAARSLGTGRRAAALAERELEDRGVSRRIARRAVVSAAKDLGETDFERAMALGRSRMRGELLNKDPATQRRRLAGVLARRGYDEETVEAVLDRLVKGGRAG
jgi:regulatory protein